MCNKKVLLLLVFLLVSGQARADDWAESYRLEGLYQFEAALNAMQSILNKSPKSEFAQMRAGWLQYQQGNYSKAISAYKNALDLNAKSIDARLGLSLPLMAQQRWREAKLYVQEVLDVAPWHYIAHTRLLVIEEVQKQWSVLQGHASSLHARYPSDATILVYLARAEDRLGNKQAAEKAFKQVLEIVPGHIEASWYINGKAK